MSDHGTDTVTKNGVLFIEDYIGEDNSGFNIIMSGSVVYIMAESKGNYFNMPIKTLTF